MQLFFLSSYCARIDTKNGLRGRLGRKRKYIMTEYPPQISLPLIALGNVYWSANLLNLLTNQAQNDQHIKAVGQKSDKFADIMLVHVNCHSFRSRLLSLQTHRHETSLFVSYAAVFVSILTQDYFLPSTRPVPFKYITLVWN